MTEETTKINVTPKHGVTQLSFSDRALGRLITIDPMQALTNDAQRDLGADVFWQLYKMNPQQVDADQLPPSRQINKMLLDWYEQSPAYDKNREATAGSLPVTRFTAGAVQHHLMTDEIYEKARELQEQAAELEEKQQEAASQADALDQAAKQEGISPEAQQQLQEQAQQKQEQADQLSEELQSILDQAGQEVGNLQKDQIAGAAMQAASQEGAQEGQEVAESMSSWGMEPGDPSYGNPNDIDAFLELNSDQVAKVAKVAGRAKGIAAQSRSQEIEGGIVPVNISRGDNLDRLLPEEIIKISPNQPAALQREGLIELVENGLLQWEMGQSAKETGPFLAAVDVSGSMWGDEIINALGLVLGMAQIAKEESRDYAIFLFESYAIKDTLITNRDDWQAHMKFAANRPRGGTNFDAALEYAQEILQDWQGTVEGTDLMFMTDGYAPLSQKNFDQWQEFTEETGSRLFYIPVNAYAANTRSPMTKLADQIIPIGDLSDNDVDQLAGKLGAWLS